jgi:hypothetical protein
VAARNKSRVRECGKKIVPKNNVRKEKEKEKENRGKVSR